MARRYQSGICGWTFVTLCLTLLGQAYGNGCPNLLRQGFTARKRPVKYSKAMAQQDFPNTRRPFKMIAGGDQGSPLTIVQDQVIKGTYPKGKLCFPVTGNSSVVPPLARSFLVLRSVGLIRTVPCILAYLICRRNFWERNRLHLVLGALKGARGGFHVISGEIFTWI